MSDACVVYRGTRVVPEDFAPPQIAQHRPTTEWRNADELPSRAARFEPVVLVADETLLDLLRPPGTVPEHAVVIAADDATSRALGPRADLALSGLDGVEARGALLDAACHLAATRFEAAALRRQIARTDAEFHELSRISISLMCERDRSALLARVVQQGRRLTESDGCGLLLLEAGDQGANVLRPILYDFASLPDVRVPPLTFPIDDNSFVGHTAVVRKPVIVEDARRLPLNLGFTPSYAFQRLYHYSQRSMMCVPMLTHEDHLLGVLLFVNRKSDPHVLLRSDADVERYVLPYTDREVRLARSLASIAATSIENGRLYLRIQRILEGLVKVAVSAIDARDPATAGHSLRVARLATALAEAVDRTDRGPYRDLHFTRAEMRELYFAAMLHDIGKIAVHENVLLKSKKLPPSLWERVTSRFELIRRTIELEYWKRRAELCAPAVENAQQIRQSERELAERLTELDQEWNIVRATNEPSLETTAPSAALDDIAGRHFQRSDGSTAPYLTLEELHYLRLPRGTLDERERAEVESHVQHTYSFLRRIPWTDDLKDLAAHAAAHHERLNGTGYPRKLMESEISLQSRIIALADTFDALTAADRSYKPAVTAQRAMELIRAEAEAGRFDRELVEIMIESQAYRSAGDAHDVPEAEPSGMPPRTDD